MQQDTYYMDKKSEEFYARLKIKLEESNTWPAEYLYKFILPNEAEKIDKLNHIFDNLGAVITTRISAKENYFSFSIHVMMENPQHVIDKYLEVAEIEGVVSL